MSRYRVTCLSLAVVAIVASAVSPAFAQPLGTFRWQWAPFCNVVTLSAVQQGNTIALAGSDDQCGAAVAAAAVGTAFVNPNGSIGVALSVTRPDGIVISSTIDVDLVTLSGAWRDEFGNSGTFQFSPPLSPTGSPRRITLKGVYSAGFNAPDTDANQVTQFSFGRTLPVAPLVPAANIIPFGGAPTTNCPGSFANPQALPGQLCLYERFKENATYQVANSEGTFDVADTIGAHIYTVPVAAGDAAISGAWAVSIP